MKQLGMILLILVWLTTGCAAPIEPVEATSAASQRTVQQGASLAEEVLEVHFIDVEQGASQLIIGPTGKTLLIDGGNNHHEETVVRYLEAQGVSTIDIMIASHPDADHVGGLDAVIDHFAVGQFYMPQIEADTDTFADVMAAAERHSLTVLPAEADLLLDWEEEALAMLVAPLDQYRDANNMSAVLYLTYGEVSFLLTGDAEAESEADMLAFGVPVQADVLLIGHHGSNTSTTELFLRAVSPSYGVIQVGEDNPYGHPDPLVIGRLEQHDVEVYRNDLHGNIVFRTDGKEIEVTYDKPSETELERLNDAEDFVPVPAPAPAEDVVLIFYENCSAVREAGKAPLYIGDPGYSRKLDRDGDGVACE